MQICQNGATSTSFLLPSFLFHYYYYYYYLPFFFPLVFLVWYSFPLVLLKHCIFITGSNMHLTGDCNISLIYAFV